LLTNYSIEPVDFFISNAPDFISEILISKYHILQIFANRGS